MTFENEYLIKFDNKYTKDNFNSDKLLYFFLGLPDKRKIKMKYVCASCHLIKNDYGIYIKDFKITDNAKGKNLTKLLNKDSKKISICRNIIKKSDTFILSAVFIDIVICNKESKSKKSNDIIIT